MIWNRKVKEANTFYSTGNINDMGLEWQEVQFFLLRLKICVHQQQEAPT